MRVLSILVNTDTPMSPELMEALTEFEFRCIGRRAEYTTDNEVREFLSAGFSPELVAEFDPTCMLTVLAPSVVLQ